MVRRSHGRSEDRPLQLISMLIYGINAVAEALRAGRVREIRIAGRDDDRVRRVLSDAARAACA